MSKISLIGISTRQDTNGRYALHPNEAPHPSHPFYLGGQRHLEALTPRHQTANNLFAALVKVAQDVAG